RGEIGTDAVVEHFPDHADVAGMHADQTRAYLVGEHVDEGAVVAGAAGGVLALAPADQPVIRLYAQDGGVEGAHLAEVAAVLPTRLDANAHPPRPDAIDTHSSPVSWQAAGELPLPGLYVVQAGIFVPISGRMASAVMRI